MASIKISGLTEQTTAADTDLIPVASSTGMAKRMTLANFVTWLTSKLNSKMQYLHGADGEAGAEGYVNIASIVIDNGYQDSEFWIKLCHRSKEVKIFELFIQFDSVENSDPNVYTFQHTGTTAGAYLCKANTSEWLLYIKKQYAWDHISVLDLKKSENAKYIYVNFRNIHTTKLPTGYITSTLRPQIHSVNGETEWLNPPMVLGVEYLTAEMWQDNHVYTQLVDCGNGPNSTQKAIEFLHNVIRCSGFCYAGDGYTISLPLIYGENKVGCHHQSGTIIIYASYDISAYKVYAQVWYTK